MKRHKLGGFRKYTQISYNPILFWQTCFSCNMEFRRERGSYVDYVPDSKRPLGIFDSIPRYHFCEKCSDYENVKQVMDKIK